MSREVTHDGMGTLEVRFPYNRFLVDLIKTLPNRRWNAADRFWAVPDADVVVLVDALHPQRFGFDRATRDLYVSMGGSLSLAEPESPSRGSMLPGLFDPPTADDPRPATERVTSPLDTLHDGAVSSDDYTVSRLNERVRDAIRAAFPSTIWLVGEISGFNKSAHRKHVSFELVERTEDGRVVSKIPATLFGGTRQSIETELRRAGEPFRLEDEISVRMRANVDLYVPWGQYRAVVEELDVNYTLGEAARRREEIVRRLTEAGLVGRNSELPLPPLPLRLGLITSLGSDAFNDVLRTLQESGYAFDITAHGARVQGHSTEPSVLNALDWFRERAEHFDLVLICRGGGSRTDLVWFDSEPLGRAVARFPLPVIVGIGHEQDLSVLDAVARSSKTPTAAAAFVVQHVGQSMERLETLTYEILERAARRIRDEKQQGLEQARRLSLAARNLLRHERTSLDHRRRRAVLGARTALASARDRLARWAALIPREGRARLERQRLFLKNALRGVRQGARRDLRAAREQIERLAATYGPRGLRRIALERERVDHRARRLHLVHPRRVVDRGYAILRLEDDRVLTRAGQAPAGRLVRAELKEGRLRLRSEGTEEPSGGE